MCVLLCAICFDLGDWLQNTTG